MMIWDVLVGAIEKYLGTYIEGVNSEKISLGILDENLILKNLALKKDALSRLLGLPFFIESSSIGKVSLRIPYSRLWSQPWQVIIEDVRISVHVSASSLSLQPPPSTSNEPLPRNDGVDQPDDQTSQWYLINKIEEKWCQAVNGLSSSSESALAAVVALDASTSTSSSSSSSSWWWWSYLTSLAYRIIKSLQVEIRNVEIRFIDTPNRRIMSGSPTQDLDISDFGTFIITLDQLMVQTATDESISAEKDVVEKSNAESNEYKRIEVSGLCIAWRPDSTPSPVVNSQVPSNKLTYLLPPVQLSGKLRRIVAGNNSSPSLEFNAELGTLSLQSSRSSCKALIAFTDQVVDQSQSMLQFTNRPSQSPSTAPRQWWKYAAFQLRPRLRYLISPERVKIEGLAEEAGATVAYVNAYSNHLLSMVTLDQLVNDQLIDSSSNSVVVAKYDALWSPNRVLLVRRLAMHEAAARVQKLFHSKRHYSRSMSSVNSGHDTSATDSPKSTDGDHNPEPSPPQPNLDTSQSAAWYSLWPLISWIGYSSCNTDSQPGNGVAVSKDSNGNGPTATSRMTAFLRWLDEEQSLPADTDTSVDLSDSCLKFCCQVAGFSLRLISEELAVTAVSNANQSKHLHSSFLSLSGQPITFAVLLRPRNGQLRLNANIESLQVRDERPRPLLHRPLFPLIVFPALEGSPSDSSSSKSVRNSFFRLSYETSIGDSATHNTNKLRIKTDPLQVVYQPELFRYLTIFLSSITSSISPGFEKSAKLKYEAMRDKTASNLRAILIREDLPPDDNSKSSTSKVDPKRKPLSSRRRGWDIDLDIAAPRLLMPNAFYAPVEASSGSSTLVGLLCDFGRLHVVNQGSDGSRQLDSLDHPEVTSDSDDYDDIFLTPQGSPTTLSDNEDESYDTGDTKRRQTNGSPAIEAETIDDLYESTTVHLDDLRVLIGPLDQLVSLGFWFESSNNGALSLPSGRGPVTSSKSMTTSRLSLIDRFSVRLLVSRRLYSLNQLSLLEYPTALSSCPPSIWLSFEQPKCILQLSDRKLAWLTNCLHPQDEFDEGSDGPEVVEQYIPSLDQQTASDQASKSVDQSQSATVAGQYSCVQRKRITMSFAINELILQFESKAQPIAECRIEGIFGTMVRFAGKGSGSECRVRMRQISIADAVSNLGDEFDLIFSTRSFDEVTLDSVNSILSEFKSEKRQTLDEGITLPPQGHFTPLYDNTGNSNCIAGIDGIVQLASLLDSRQTSSQSRPTSQNTNTLVDQSSSHVFELSLDKISAKFIRSLSSNGDDVDPLEGGMTPHKVVQSVITLACEGFQLIVKSDQDRIVTAVLDYFELTKPTPSIVSLTDCSTLSIGCESDSKGLNICLTQSQHNLQKTTVCGSVNWLTYLHSPAVIVSFNTWLDEFLVPFRSSLPISSTPWNPVDLPHLNLSLTDTIILLPQPSSPIERFLWFHLTSISICSDRMVTLPLLQRQLVELSGLDLVVLADSRCLSTSKQASPPSIRHRLRDNDVVSRLVDCDFVLRDLHFALDFSIAASMDQVPWFATPTFTKPINSLLLSLLEHSPDDDDDAARSCQEPLQTLVPLTAKILLADCNFAQPVHLLLTKRAVNQMVLTFQRLFDSSDATGTCNRDLDDCRPSQLPSRGRDKEAFSYGLRLQSHSSFRVELKSDLDVDPTSSLVCLNVDQLTTTLCCPVDSVMRIHASFSRFQLHNTLPPLQSPVPTPSVNTSDRILLSMPAIDQLGECKECTNKFQLILVRFTQENRSFLDKFRDVEWFINFVGDSLTCRLLPDIWILLLDLFGFKLSEADLENVDLDQLAHQLPVITPTDLVLNGKLSQLDVLLTRPHIDSSCPSSNGDNEIDFALARFAEPSFRFTTSKNGLSDGSCLSLYSSPALTSSPRSDGESLAKSLFNHAHCLFTGQADNFEILALSSPDSSLYRSRLYQLPPTSNIKPTQLCIQFANSLLPLASQSQLTESAYLHLRLSSRLCYVHLQSFFDAFIDNLQSLLTSRKLISTSRACTLGQKLTPSTETSAKIKLDISLQGGGEVLVPVHETSCDLLVMRFDQITVGNDFVSSLQQSSPTQPPCSFIDLTHFANSQSDLLFCTPSSPSCKSSWCRCSFCDEKERSCEASDSNQQLNSHSASTSETVLAKPAHFSDDSARPCLVNRIFVQLSNVTLCPAKLVNDPLQQGDNKVGRHTYRLLSSNSSELTTPDTESTTLDSSNLLNANQPIHHLSIRVDQNLTPANHSLPSLVIHLPKLVDVTFNLDTFTYALIRGLLAFNLGGSDSIDDDDDVVAINPDKGLLHRTSRRVRLAERPTHWPLRASREASITVFTALPWVNFAIIVDLRQVKFSFPPSSASTDASPAICGDLLLERARFRFDSSSNHSWTVQLQADELALVDTRLKSCVTVLEPTASSAKDATSTARCNPVWIYYHSSGSSQKVPVNRFSLLVSDSRLLLDLDWMKWASGVIFTPPLQPTSTMHSHRPDPVLELFVRLHNCRIVLAERLNLEGTACLFRHCPGGDSLNHSTSTHACLHDLRLLTLSSRAEKSSQRLVSRLDHCSFDASLCGRRQLTSPVSPTASSSSIGSGLLVKPGSPLPTSTLASLGRRSLAYNYPTIRHSYESNDLVKSHQSVCIALNSSKFLVRLSHEEFAIVRQAGIILQDKVGQLIDRQDCDQQPRSSKKSGFMQQLFNILPSHVTEIKLDAGLYLELHDLEEQFGGTYDNVGESVSPMERIPLLSFGVDNLFFHWFRPLTASSLVSLTGLSVNYYNRDLLAWEPFVEPWSFLAEFSQTKSPGGLDRNSFTLTSTDSLNFNATASLILLIRRLTERLESGQLANQWSPAQPVECLFDQSSLNNFGDHQSQGEATQAPFRLANQTGSLVWYKVFPISHLNDQQNPASGDSHESWNELSIDSSPIDLGPSNQLDRLNDRGDTHSSLCLLVQVEGWKSSYPVSMDRPGLFFQTIERLPDRVCYNLNPSLSARLPVFTRLVFAIERISSRQHLVILRSGLTITNDELRVNCRQSALHVGFKVIDDQLTYPQPDQFIQSVAPNQSVAVPINIAALLSVGAGLLCFRPFLLEGTPPRSSPPAYYNWTRVIDLDQLSQSDDVKGRRIRASKSLLTATTAHSAGYRPVSGEEVPAPGQIIDATNCLSLHDAARALDWTSIRHTEGLIEQVLVTEPLPLSIDDGLLNASLLTLSDQSVSNRRPVVGLTQAKSSTVLTSSSSTTNSLSRLHYLCLSITRQPFPQDSWHQLVTGAASVDSLPISLPGHHITIGPTLRVVNLLPCSLSYNLIGTSLSIELKAGEDTCLYEISPLESIRFGVHLDGFPRCGPLIIPPNAYNKRVLLRVFDQADRPLDLQVHVLSRANGPRQITISAVIWLINQSGLPLIFSQSTSWIDSVATKAAGQSEEHEQACSAEPLLFSFADRDEANLLRVRLGRSAQSYMSCCSFGNNALLQSVDSLDSVSSLWSPTISLDKPGVDLLELKLVAKEGKKRFSSNLYVGFEVREGSGRHSLSTVVTFKPRYVIENQSSYRLEFAQKSSESAAAPGLVSLESGSSQAFHWPSSRLDRLLTMRALLSVNLDNDVSPCPDDTSTTTEWSGGLTLDRPQSLMMMLRLTEICPPQLVATATSQLPSNRLGLCGSQTIDPCHPTQLLDRLFLRVVVSLDVATFRLMIDDASDVPPPFRLENYTQLTIFYHQSNPASIRRDSQSVGDEGDDPDNIQPPSSNLHLAPMSIAPYALEEPMFDPVLNVGVQGGMANAYDLNRIGDGPPLFYNNHVYLTFRAASSDALFSSSRIASSSPPPIIQVGPIDLNLVFDVRPGSASRQVVYSTKRPGHRSQLWNVSDNGLIYHEGSSSPREQYFQPLDSSRQKRRQFVLDVDLKSDATGLLMVDNVTRCDFEVVRLIIAPPSKRRKAYQTWRIDEHGLLVNSALFCVQLHRVFSQHLVNSTSDALLGTPILAAKPRKSATSLLSTSLTPARIRPTWLRPGSGCLTSSLTSTGFTRVLRFVDAASSVGGELLGSDGQLWSNIDQSSITIPISNNQFCNSLHSPIKDPDDFAPQPFMCDIVLPMGVSLSVISTYAEELVHISLLDCRLQLSRAPPPPQPTSRRFSDSRIVESEESQSNAPDGLYVVGDLVASSEPALDEDADDQKESSLSRHSPLVDIALIDIGHLQIDSQFHDASLPVMVYPDTDLASPSRRNRLPTDFVQQQQNKRRSMLGDVDGTVDTASIGSNSSAPHPLREPLASIAFRRSVVNRRPVNVNVHVFDRFMLRLQPLIVEAEEVLLLKLIQFYQQTSLPLTNHPLPSASSLERVDKTRDEKSYHHCTLFSTGSDVARGDIYCFNQLVIHPINIRLSVQTAKQSLAKSHLQGVKRLLPSLMSFTNAEIKLAPIAMSHIVETLPYLTQSLAQHFQLQLRSNATRIFGSVDFLGNPIGFITDLTYGISGLVDLDVGGLIRHVAHGVGDSTAKVAGSMSHLLTTISLDKQHQLERASILGGPNQAVAAASTTLPPPPPTRAVSTVDQSATTSATHRSTDESLDDFELTRMNSRELVPVDQLDGSDARADRLAPFNAGIRGLLHGLVGGATSIVTQPYRGIKEEQFKGFVYGVGKGLIGTVIKPLGGILDFVSGAMTSLSELAQPSGRGRPRRRRPRRAGLSCYSILTPLTIQSIERAICQLQLRTLPLFTTLTNSDRVAFQFSPVNLGHSTVQIELGQEVDGDDEGQSVSRLLASTVDEDWLSQLLSSPESVFAVLPVQASGGVVVIVTDRAIWCLANENLANWVRSQPVTVDRQATNCDWNQQHQLAPTLPTFCLTDHHSNLLFRLSYHRLDQIRVLDSPPSSYVLFVGDCGVSSQQLRCDWPGWSRQLAISIAQLQFRSLQAAMQLPVGSIRPLTPPSSATSASATPQLHWGIALFRDHPFALTSSPSTRTS